MWDRRNVGSAFLKITAHSSNGFAVAWSPTREWVLATGSRDKTVKVWDLSDLVAETASTSHTSNAVPRPLHTLFAPSAVGRISWRPGRGNVDQLVTAAADGGTGEILIWNVKHAHVPVCVLHGHEDVCSGLVWMDTPGSLAAFEETEEATSNSPFRSWVNSQQVAEDQSQR